MLNRVLFHRGLINNGLRQAFSVQGAVGGCSAVAFTWWGGGALCLEYSVVVGLDDCFHAAHAAVANFYVVPIEDFVKSVCCREML